jgi:hypothetical protein
VLIQIIPSISYQQYLDKTGCLAFFYELHASAFSVINDGFSLKHIVQGKRYGWG